MDRLLDVEGLTTELRTFAEDRDWDQFHNPKNLALALAGEVGELCAELQWLTEAEATAEGMSETKLRATAAEAADVVIYLVRLCDRLNIDLDQAVRSKMAENHQRYSVETSRGSAEKAPPAR